MLLALSLAGFAAADNPTAKPFLAEPPSPRFQPLPGKVIGVVAGDADALLTEEGRRGPPDAVGFASDRTSYRWFYLPCRKGDSDAETVALPVGPEGKSKRRFSSVCLATRSGVRPLGLDGKFHLVQVEVNDGEGSPAVDSFFASGLTVLDGSREFPLQVDAVLARLKERFRRECKDQRKAIEDALSNEAKAALGERQASGPREESQQLYVTWLRDAELLHVEMRARVTDGLYSSGKGTEKGPTPRPDPAVAPPARKDPARNGMRYGTRFGVDALAVYEVNRSGELISSHPLELKTFTEHLPPPRSAP